MILQWPRSLRPGPPRSAQSNPFRPPRSRPIAPWPHTGEPRLWEQAPGSYTSPEAVRIFRILFFDSLALLSYSQRVTLSQPDLFTANGRESARIKNWRAFA